MNACARFLVAGCAVALGGCGTLKDMASGPVGCTKGNCKVTLEVSGTPPNCSVRVTPDELYVAQSNKDDDMMWRIDGNDFVFTGQGIVFKSANSQFTGHGGSANNVKWRNANTDRRGYRYNIFVEKRQGGAKCDKIDPTVMNGAADPSIQMQFQIGPSRTY